MKKAALPAFLLLFVFYVTNAQNNTEINNVPVKSYTYAPTSHKLKRSLKIRAGVYYNENKWKILLPEKGEDTEFKFSHVKGNGYAMFISDKSSIPMEHLRTIAIDNAKSESEAFTLDKEEYRIVNGIKLLCLQISVKMQGTSYVYLGYYYSGDDGVAQFLTYTSKTLFKDYKDDFEELLNGFIKLK